VNDRAAYRILTTNVLSTGKLSPFSLQFLQRFALTEEYQNNPRNVLTTLHAGLGAPDESSRLFTLAELSYDYAQNDGDRAYFLASAFYAYAFLFPENSAQQPSSYDPRLRLAADLYNRGVANGLRDREKETLNLEPRQIALPFALLGINLNRAKTFYAGYRLTNLVPSADLQVRGLRNRYRAPGFGTALVAEVETLDDRAPDRWIPEDSKIPVTAFMRFSSPRLAFSDHQCSATIELYDGHVTTTTVIGEHTVPLEVESTAALAYRLEDSDLWDFEIAGFRKPNFHFFEKESGGELYFLHPYCPGRIPVVFVHGTASSPARWSEMVNELLADPAIASRYQFWFFIYNSGNPVALSALSLRESLQDAVNDLTPQAKDSELQQMVVIGHSQGGLLTKMMVVNSGNRFWEDTSSQPFEEASLSPETKDLLHRSLFVKPLPFVQRVTFIATPHRGSYLTENILGQIGRKLINLPATVTKVGLELAMLDPAEAAKTALLMPTALDNMNWSNPFLRTLESLPIAEGVRVNSIVAVKGSGPAEEGNDGVVRYQSAHLNQADSEFIVRSGHSTQSNPHTIEEVRRILYEHVRIGPHEESRPE